MSKKPAPQCKPRFKGVENFLRRVAFNLGNTPSQTEVKIISCIPIDVSDLQNRICELEREVETYSVLCSPPNVRHICHTALVNVPPPQLGPPTALRRDSHGSFTYNAPNTHPSEIQPHCGPSEPCPTRPVNPERNTPRASEHSQPHCNTTQRTGLQRAAADPNRTVSRLSVNSNQRSSALNHALGEPQTHTAEPKGQINKERHSAKRTRKSHLVYYTQTTTNSPFSPQSSAAVTKTNKGVTNKTRGAATERKFQEKMSETYLSKVMRRQYGTRGIASEVMTSSEFSAPVCRDCPGAAPLARLDSEMCSCWGGAFRDVDLLASWGRAPRTPLVWDTTPPALTDASRSTTDGNGGGVFYDSSLYDLVPVREKYRCNDELFTDNGQVFSEPCYVCPGNSIKARTKPRKQHHHNAVTVRTNPRFCHRKKTLIKPVQRKESLNGVTSRKNKQREFPKTETVSAVDCSAVYVHPGQFKRISVPPQPAPAPIEVKNVECLTRILNNSECQTASTKSIQLDPIETPDPDENKTEITLKQIKSILQSVLTEVKTSARNGEAKRDAVVQKGQSQNNMQPQKPAASASLHPIPQEYSMDYGFSNPYNVYAPSCSRALPNQTTARPAAPLSPFPPPCLQNYPLFIQTTGHQCSCCFRTLPKRVRNRPPPTTTATNTERPLALEPSHSRETNKLIQDIYKSIAVNMDFLSKDPSNSEFSVWSERRGVASGSTVGARRRSGAVRRPAAVACKPAPVVSPALVSKTPVFPTRMRPGSVCSKSRPRSACSKPSLPRSRRALHHRRYRCSSSSPSRSTSTLEESDTDKTVMELPVQDRKPTKQSLFKKMVNLFSGKKRSRKKKSEEEDEQESTEGTEYCEEESEDNATEASRTWHPRRHRMPSGRRYKLQPARQEYVEWGGPGHSDQSSHRRRQHRHQY